VLAALPADYRNSLIPVWRKEKVVPTEPNPILYSHTTAEICSLFDLGILNRYLAGGRRRRRKPG